MWRRRIQSLTSNVTFADPAAFVSIQDAEEKLGVQLPAELAEILRESDGVMGEYGLSLLWTIDRIREENVRFRNSAHFRNLYMPFDCLLFFSDAGNGDQFAYSIIQGEVRRNHIFVWNHEDDSRTFVAPSLGVFYDWWLSGKLKI